MTVKKVSYARGRSVPHTDLLSFSHFSIHYQWNLFDVRCIQKRTKSLFQFSIQFQYISVPESSLQYNISYNSSSEVFISREDLLERTGCTDRSYSFVSRREILRLSFVSISHKLDTSLQQLPEACVKPCPRRPWPGSLAILQFISALWTPARHFHFFPYTTIRSFRRS